MASALGPLYGGLMTLRHVPQPGSIGCPGSCPLCCSSAAPQPPCLACRDEMRERLTEMNTRHYVATACN